MGRSRVGPDSIERLEDLVEVIGPDPGAGIPDFDDSLVI
jgi:hypothetical protein